MENFTPDLKARSPWAVLEGVKVAEVAPADKAMEAEIRVPGSKSFTNRALIIGAAAKGTSRFSGVLRSDDSYWCMEILRHLGVKVRVEGDTVEIEGTDGNFPIKNANLYLGAAGTTARFLPGILAASKNGHWVIEGSKRMNERPMGPLLTALKELGANIESLEKDGYLPIKVTADGIKGGQVEISGNTSSQFISGLLIAAAYADSPVTIHIIDHIVQHAYVKITIDLMRKFGVTVEHDEQLKTISVTPQHYSAKEMQLEADASTACYFFALAALTNGKVRVTNLTYNTYQPDIQFVDVLEKMGCTVIKGEDFIEVKGCPRLKGGFTTSMKEMSDQTLTLAAIAPFADGPVAISGVAHIRKHESDRIHAICESLQKMQIKVEEREDGLTVYPGTPVGTELSSYDDHRVAMSLSLIGAKVPGVRILDPGCVSKTCPTYFTELEKIGLQVTLEK
ncbi:3-phosphoshikimate 1-carboxyvinyltransferase [Bacillaceae bacterium Marseille-Q3522]|nr:3-phosphoshikimate 1-carboxyvinyltransferase [Bacillaceae bacterium Marseille-Q3522]